MRSSNKGIALITALFVTAIATITVVSLLDRQHIDIRRTANVINSDQAYVYALGMEVLARELLIKYAETNNAPYDKPDLYMPQAFPVDGGMITGKLMDMESKFNVNNLIKSNQPDAQGRIVADVNETRRFTRILQKVINDLQLSGVSASDLTDAVVDWIDADANQLPGGAEDSVYMSADPPYRAANRMLASPTELLLIQGFSRELLYGKVIEEKPVPGLLAYVTALPDNYTVININTVDPNLLLTFATDWNAAQVEEALQGRPFKDVGEFTGHAAFANIGSGDAANQTRIKEQFKADIYGLDVQSSYLMIDGMVTMGDSHSKLNSLIYRTTTASKIFTLSRSQGTEGI